MKFIFTVVFILVTTISFSQIRVGESVQNFGDIFENSGKVTTKFKLQNPYREDTIHIVNIETSCGCTAVLAQDTLILPQSSIFLDVSYDPLGRLGLFVKSIEINTRTGRDERNKLFLKIEGNVISENYAVKEVDKELVQYLVAPIYFYPITSFDTSYLDFNYITTFVNDLTFEIDFHQFTTVGIEVEVPDHADIERMEYLLNFSKKKVLKEFKRRGFAKEMVFFDEPIFKKAKDLPSWAEASIRLFSVNFDAKDRTESAIKVTSTEVIEETKMLMDYQRFALPEIEDILAQVNFETIESKLFLNGELELSGTIYMPWKKSESIRNKMAEDIKNAVLKEIKKSTGAGKKEIKITIDPSGIHPDNKYRFILWDEADQEEDESLVYVVKPDEITPPFLPTYKQVSETDHINKENPKFKHFFDNCLRNYNAGYDIRFLIEYSELDDMVSENFIAKVKIKADRIKRELEVLFASLPKNGTIDFDVKTNIRGSRKFSKKEALELDESLFNYFTIIPIVHNKSDLKIPSVRPFQVNFDFFFNGVDTGAWGFQRFSNYILSTIQKDGFIELRIESSISEIPVERHKSNLFLAFKRLLESERRLREAMEKRLIDPNRILFSGERAIVQGPKYDGSIPILKYREFHYIQILPEKILKNEK